MPRFLRIRSRLDALFEPQRVLFSILLKASYARKAGGSAICKKREENSLAAPPIVYLFFIIYSKSTVDQLTKLKFYTSTIFICFFHTLNKAFLRNPSILRFEVPFCSGHCFLCHCIKIIFCDFNVFKAYRQPHT